MAELPADTGSILTQKLGPLPTWGWGIVILGGVYGWKLYTQHKAGGRVDTSAGYESAQLPSNIQPQYTQVDEGGSWSFQNSPISVIGRQYNEDMDEDQDDDDAPTSNAHAPTPKSPKPKPKSPKPKPKPVDPKPHTPHAKHDVVGPPAPKGEWITVVKWNPNDRNAPSTLTGLALKAYGNAGAWGRIWNAPQNKDLVNRRGDPAKIQPGDRFWAPA